MNQTNTRSSPPQRKAGMGSLAMTLLLFVLGLIILQNALGTTLAGRHYVIIVPAAATLVLFAGWTLGTKRGLEAFSSSSMAITLLAFIAVACILATLTLQRRELGSNVPEQEYEEQFKMAEASFLYRLLHPFSVPRVTIEKAREKYYEILQEHFGEEHAKNQRKQDIRQIKNYMVQGEIREFAARHDPFLRGLKLICDRLRLTDAYRSWWFVFLLMVLGVNVVLCATGRIGLGMRRIGFTLVHLGVVVLLIGAGIGTCLEQKGIWQFVLDRRDTFDSFFDLANDAKEVFLNFSVRLKAFRTEYHKKLFVEFLDVPWDELPPGAGLEKSFEVGEGRKISLKRGQVSLQAEEFMPEAIVRTEIVDRPEHGENPVVQLAIQSNEGVATATLIAFDEEENVYYAPENEFRVKFVWQPPKNFLQQELEKLGSRNLGILRVRTRNGEQSFPIEKVGQLFEVHGLKLRIEEICPDFAQRGLKPMGKQTPRNPAVKLSLQRDNESEVRWYFSRPEIQEFYLSIHPVKQEDVQISLDFPGWESPCPQRFLLVGDGGAELNVFSISGKKAAGPRNVKVGSSLDTLGIGARISVKGLYRHAALQHDILQYEPPAGTDQIQAYFDNPSQPALKLRVKAPSFDETAWLVANSRVSTFDRPGFIKITYADDRQMKPIDWKSMLQILEEGKVVKSGVVEVNKPFYYQGYRFYQTDADPDRPDYSGIQVVRDPGWPFAFAGLIMIVVGVLHAFYVQPLMKGKRRG